MCDHGVFTYNMHQSISTCESVPARWMRGSVVAAFAACLVAALASPVLSSETAVPIERAASPKVSLTIGTINTYGVAFDYTITLRKLSVGGTATLGFGGSKEESDSIAVDATLQQLSESYGTIIIVRTFAGAGAFIGYRVINANGVFRLQPGVLLGLWTLYDYATATHEIPDAVKKHIVYQFGGPVLRLAIGGRRVRFCLEGAALFNLSQVTVQVTSGVEIVHRKPME
jgi:hypothetical protein